MELVKQFRMSLDVDIPIQISPELKKELAIIKSAVKKDIRTADLTQKEVRMLKKMVKDNMIELIERSTKYPLTSKQEKELSSMINALNNQYFGQEYGISVATIITYIYILVVLGVMIYFWYESFTACNIEGYGGLITQIAEKLTMRERMCIRNAEHFNNLAWTIGGMATTAYPVVSKVIKQIAENPEGVIKLFKHPELLTEKEKSPQKSPKKSPPKSPKKSP